MTTSSPWFILIYETEDAISTAHLAHELEQLGSLIVQTEDNNDEHFVIVECPSTLPAISMHELVMTIDPQASLVETHASPQKSLRIAQDVAL
jgi:hypothetical protein